MSWAERTGWVAFGLAALAVPFLITVRPVGYDVRAYLIAARAVAEGRPLYPPADAPLVLDLGAFLYPPPVAAVFVPFLVLPPEVATWAIVALLVGLAAALGTVLVAPSPRAVRPWAATAIALFFPLLLEVNVGNMDLVTVALVLGAWRLRDRPVRGGGLLAAAVGLKLVAAAVVLFYVASGRWRQLGWAAAIGVAVVVVTLPFQADAWRDFIALLLRMATTEIRSEAIDIRPDAVRSPVGQLVLAAVAAAVAIAAGIAARRDAARASDLHALALGAAPLAAPAIWYTYLVLALPLLAAEARSLAPRAALLLLPLGVWVAMEAPLELRDWRFAGLCACIAVGTVHFALPALRRARAY